LNSQRDDECNVAKFGLTVELVGGAILRENSLLNRIPLKTMEETPYELWKCLPSSYQHLKV